MIGPGPTGEKMEQNADKMANKTISVRLEPKEQQGLADLCKKYDLNITNMVRMLINEKIDSPAFKADTLFSSRIKEKLEFLLYLTRQIKPGRTDSFYADLAATLEKEMTKIAN